MSFPPPPSSSSSASSSSSSSMTSTAAAALDAIKSSASDASTAISSSLQSAASTIAQSTGSLLSSSPSSSSDFLYSDLYSVTVRLHSVTALPHPVDGYVTLTVGKEQRQSRTLKHGRGDAELRFNETFSFVCKDRPTQLQLELREHRLLGKNPIIGHASVDLEPLIATSEKSTASNPPTDASISAEPAPSTSPTPSTPTLPSTSSSPEPGHSPTSPLPPPHSPSPPPPSSSPSPASASASPSSPPAPSSELRLALQGAASGELQLTVIATSITQVVGRSSSHELSDVQEGDIDALTSLLDLTLLSASSLKREHLFSQDSTYAVVSFGFQQFRTPVVERSNAPRYDQVCPIWLKRDTQSFVLKLSIYQREGRYSHDALIGNAFLRVNELQTGQHYSLNLPLTKEEPHTDRDLQELLASLSFDVEKGGADAAKSGPCGSVQVEVVLKKREVVEAEIYEQLMHVYDENGDGRLEEEEIVHLCQTVGAKLSDEDIRKALQETAGPAGSAGHAEGGEGGAVLSVSRQQLPALFRRAVFRRSDFLRTLHAVALHGHDALHSLMLKNFLYPASSSSTKQHGGQAVQVGEMDEADPTVDNDNTRILVFDRDAGIVVKEEIPAYIKAAMRLMYRSRGGRVIGHLGRTRALLKSLTLKQGKKMDSPASVNMIPVFIHTHHLNVDEVEKPIAEYRTFNEFFYRKLRPGVRLCEAADDNRVLVSPADCRMMVFDSIEQAKQLWVKGKQFSIAATLAAADGDGSLTAKLSGGSLVIARLAPQDYHRWHWPVAGRPGERTPIAGGYNTVNPIAIRKDVDVYTDNKRCVCPIDTADFGTVVLVAVAATMVGSIGFVDASGSSVKRFDEHGWFAFGGSTVLLFFTPGAVSFDEDLHRNSAKSLETLVKVGRRIGVATRARTTQSPTATERNGGQAEAKQPPSPPKEHT